MKYDMILFDADETLFDFEKSERVAFQNTIEEFGIRYQKDYHLKLYQEINTAVWKELADGLIAQNDLNLERFSRFVKRIHAEVSDVDFADTYVKYLSQASFLFEDSAAVVQKLNETCRIAVVTNGLSKVQDGRIRKSVIGQYFEAVIVSEDVGVTKPNAEIFECVFHSAPRVAKSKILMVGDSLSSDIQGGINFGVDTCWVNRSHAENKTAVSPTYEISELSELLEIVKD